MSSYLDEVVKTTRSGTIQALRFELKDLFEFRQAKPEEEYCYRNSEHQKRLCARLRRIRIKDRKQIRVLVWMIRTLEKNV